MQFQNKSLLHLKKCVDGLSKYQLRLGHDTIENSEPDKSFMMYGRHYERFLRRWEKANAQSVDENS